MFLNWGERPSRRKALETDTGEELEFDVVELGANAPHAERHWRQKESGFVVFDVRRGANAPHAERHWRLESRRGNLSVSATGANAPHAERHWRRPQYDFRSYFEDFGGERPSRRKALETRVDPAANSACTAAGRTPLTPKGIGDSH